MFTGLLLLRRPLRRRCRHGNGQRVQFIARQLFRQPIFNQTMARQPRFAFKRSRDNLGEKMMPVAFHFNQFARGNLGNQLFNCNRALVLSSFCIYFVIVAYAKISANLIDAITIKKPLSWLLSQELADYN